MGTPRVGTTSEDSKTIKARIFDRRRISIIGVAFVIVLIAVVSVSSWRFAKPPPISSATSTSTPPHPTEDRLPHLHKYAWVFVAYDKFGYTVAHQFYEQLQKSMEDQDRQTHRNGGHLQEQFIDSRSQFNAETQCPDFNLESSTVTIFESPEFHCSMAKLRSLFMDHKDLTQEKWGVKLIHLVRNPFSMAVASYRDRKSIRAPEEVRFKNPCTSLTQTITTEGGTNWSVAGLNSPLLSENGIMSEEYFDLILANCQNIYQTRPGLERASYQQHLEQLPPAVGLRLAVADGLNSVAQMASGLIVFDQVRALMQEEMANPDWKKTRYLDIMTVPLDEVLDYPGNSMVDFLDFVFGEHMSSYSKHKAAKDYERNRIGEDFSTDAKEREKLIGLLRDDPLFGGPLKRVESLLESVLSEQERSEAEG